MTNVLSARGVSVSFGGVHAVVDVDLDVEPGELVGLIGPNGAGKTTFVDAITGFVPHRGTTALDGADITSLSPHERARRGLARTWQAIELFDDLTVRENLTVAANHPSLLATFKEIFTSRADRSDMVDDALEVWLGQFAEATERAHPRASAVVAAPGVAARPVLVRRAGRRSRPTVVASWTPARIVYRARRSFRSIMPGARAGISYRVVPVLGSQGDRGRYPSTARDPKVITRTGLSRHRDEGATDEL